MENWILAKNLLGENIKVRQNRPYGDIFVDENDNDYKAYHLDFTDARVVGEETANATADHKAVIEEREYWRKLRGEVFLSVMHEDWVANNDEALRITDYIVRELYKQDFEFFKDKMMFSFNKKTS